MVSVIVMSSVPRRDGIGRRWGRAGLGRQAASEVVEAGCRSEFGGDALLADRAAQQGEDLP
ncbi:hypothetical protein ACFU7Y_13555 [Kitasatospora sp. NPDC057542]|uniref:hypothetical protein n=1 Tax=Kitasatospora sp. NPDC057542 TaxID=3346162 RepID=UPI00367E04C4